MQVTVTAHKWRGGWELHHGDDCWTQVTDLRNARQQVVDYLDTVNENVDHSNWSIEVIPEIGDLAREVAASREAAQRASEATQEAAVRSRVVVRHLREAGYTVADSAAILGVSRGRISQLAKQS